MKKFLERRAGIFVVTLFGITLFGIMGLQAEEAKVIATTEWTAAFSRAAGVEPVKVLAPANLQHPPEYELKPSDIPTLMETDIIVFGGYEGMMKRIRSHIAGSDVKLVQIKTVYAPAIIKASVMDIARAAGTEDAARANLKKIDAAYEKSRRHVARNFPAGTSALVHSFQVPMATALGLKIAGRFGPTPPGSKNIAAAAESDARIIIDNWHNAVSAPLREVLGKARAVELINFPGRKGTSTIEEVIYYNAAVLTGKQVN